MDATLKVYNESNRYEVTFVHRWYSRAHGSIPMWCVDLLWGVVDSEPTNAQPERIAEKKNLRS